MSQSGAHDGIANRPAVSNYMDEYGVRENFFQKFNSDRISGTLVNKARLVENPQIVLQNRVEIFASGGRDILSTEGLVIVAYEFLPDVVGFRRAMILTKQHDDASQPKRRRNFFGNI